MSWAEVSKVNGDFLNAPLDIKMHLADYKMYGEDSYVFQQKELLHELYECSYLSMNDKELSAEALEYLLKNNKHIGEAFSNVYDIERKDLFKTLRAMTAVLNSSTAMTAVLNSSTAMTAVANSSTAMTAVANSSTAMQAVFNKEEMMTCILNSTNCMLLKNTGLPGANGYQCYGKFILIGSTYQYDCVDSCIPDYRSLILSKHSKVIDTSKFGKIFVKIGVQGVPLNTVYTMLDDANGGNLCVVYKL